MLILDAIAACFSEPVKGENNLIFVFPANFLGFVNSDYILFLLIKNIR